MLVLLTLTTSLSCVVFHGIHTFSATTCQKPFNPPHMTSSCSGDKVGDKCTFTCAQGYNLVGANERTCRNDGQWSHSLPHCQGISLYLRIFTLDRLVVAVTSVVNKRPASEILVDNLKRSLQKYHLRYKSLLMKC